MLRARATAAREEDYLREVVRCVEGAVSLAPRAQAPIDSVPSNPDEEQTMSRPIPTRRSCAATTPPGRRGRDPRSASSRARCPRDLEGTLWRNGPNPQFAPRGRYHWFDGDGMIHAFRIRDGRVSYRNRWVRTARFQLERAAGEALFGGLADMASTDPRVAPSMTSPNAANTNIVLHAGKLLALWEGGPPHALDPRTLETEGPYDFGGKLDRRR